MTSDAGGSFRKWLLGRWQRAQDLHSLCWGCCRFIFVVAAAVGVVDVDADVDVDGVVFVVVVCCYWCCWWCYWWWWCCGRRCWRRSLLMLLLPLSTLRCCCCCCWWWWWCWCCHDMCLLCRLFLLSCWCWGRPGGVMMFAWIVTITIKKGCMLLFCYCIDCLLLLPFWFHGDILTLTHLGSRPYDIWYTCQQVAWIGTSVRHRHMSAYTRWCCLLLSLLLILLLVIIYAHINTWTSLFVLAVVAEVVAVFCVLLVGVFVVLKVLAIVSTVLFVVTL